MLSLTTSEPDHDVFRRYPAHVDRLLHGVVREGTQVGYDTMRELVPSASGKLRGAVGKTGPTVIDPGHFEGVVVVDPLVAPHAEAVDKGTGVDGPFKTPVSRVGPSQTGRPLTMQLPPKGGYPIYHRVVKARPSSKIERGKNFSGRTYEVVRDWARLRTGILQGQLALHFVDEL